MKYQPGTGVGLIRNPTAMKNRFLFKTLAAMALLVPVLGLTSCSNDDDDDGWWGGPPQGWNTFFDRALTGTWQLVQADGKDVTGFSTNFMTFYSNGTGYYYEYEEGELDREEIRYWCQNTDTTESGKQINIQYDDDAQDSATMSYWFTDGDLWLQWMNNKDNKVVTYVYSKVESIP